jgi:hypothetical protein
MKPSQNGFQQRLIRHVCEGGDLCPQETDVPAVSPSCILVPMKAVMSCPTREASVTKLYPTLIGDVRTRTLTGDHKNTECLKGSYGPLSLNRCDLLRSAIFTYSCNGSG